MDISLELKGLPCLNKVYLLTYLLTYLVIVSRLVVVIAKLAFVLTKG